MIILLTAFYNEIDQVESYVETLRNQTDDVWVILVDNNSTDGTREYLANLEEVVSSKWFLIKEEKQGQLYALLTGLKYAQFLGYGNAFLFDMDSKFTNKFAWSKINEYFELQNSDNYSYLPMRYVMDGEPNDITSFVNGYESYLIDVVYKKIGWFATGSASIIPVRDSIPFLERLLKESREDYFNVAEKDLRLSLYLLGKGYGYCLH